MHGKVQNARDFCRSCFVCCFCSHLGVKISQLALRVRQRERERKKKELAEEGEKSAESVKITREITYVPLLGLGQVLFASLAF